MKRNPNKVAVHLISAPWSGYKMPSIQLGALKADLARRFGSSVPVHTHSAFFTIPFNLGGIEFLHKGGEDLNRLHYAYLSLLPPDMMPGLSAYQGRLRALCPTWLNLADLKSATDKFIEEEIIPRLEADGWNILGFTIPLYSQLYAALYCAMALQGKCLASRSFFLFGGDSANCGRTHAAIRETGLPGFIVLGEGEQALADLVDRCLRSDDIDELFSRADFPRDGLVPLKADPAPSSSEFQGGEVQQIQDLSRLPEPDYSEFFQTLRKCLGEQHLPFIAENVWLPVEGGRGCRFACSFCNFKRSWKGRRVKTVSRISTEVIDQSAQWKTSKVMFVDSSCDDWALPFAQRMIARGVSIESVMALRSNHSVQFWIQLALSGVSNVQLGIESLATSLLKKMRKGVSTFDNIRTLKYLKELGVQSWSNIITHFPGSNVSEIAETQRILRLIPHFCPLGLSRFKLVSGSPLFDRLPQGIRGDLPFQHPPAVPSDLSAIIVAPDFRLPADLALDHETSSAWDRFTDWYAVRKEHAEQHKPVMRVTTRIPGKRIDILDSRFDEPQTWMLLDERAVVYDLCHDGSTFDALNDRCAVDRPTLRSAIDELTANELLVCVDDRYLSLALRPGHLVIKDHLEATDPVREASPDEVLIAEPSRRG